MLSPTRGYDRATKRRRGPLLRSIACISFGFQRLKRTLLYLLAIVAVSCTGLPSPAGSQGFYRVVEKGGAWWFAKPGGGEIFSLGVDCVGIGGTREKFRADRPAYAAFRYYPDNGAWAKDTLARLRSWNFNTLGGWCDLDMLKAVAGEDIPYAEVLHLGESFHAPWCDMFSAEFARQLDGLARKLVTPYNDDPRLLGYFSDNELGWWDDTLFLFFLRQPSQNATRRALMRLLRERYHSDFSRFRCDFEAHGARSFADLERKADLTLRPGGSGESTVKQFVTVLARHYYQLAHDSIRRYDKNHLLLGDRYAQYCAPEVARAARDYVDVISTNYGADWLDGGISHFYLEMLHRITSKPVLITEFYMCAMENQSGNKNSSDGFPVVETQTERATAFRNNISSLAATPYVVGAHWFQYYDEPSRGRGDGENYNMGLVDIDNRPYELMTTAVARLPIDEIHRSAGGAASTISGVPPARGDPLSGLRSWDRASAFVPGRSLIPIADLYVCWDAKHLYLAVFTEEFADTKLYAGGKIPLKERMTWTIALGGSRKPIRIRFGAGGHMSVGSDVIEYKTVAAGTRLTALIAFSPEQAGMAKFTAGSAFPLHASLTSHGHAERMEWETNLRLAGYRL